MDDLAVAGGRLGPQRRVPLYEDRGRRWALLREVLRYREPDDAAADDLVFTGWLAFARFVFRRVRVTRWTGIRRE